MTITSIRTECPHCHAGYDVPSQACGRWGKCANCNERFVVYDLAAPALDPFPLLANRKYAGTNCHVCGTRLYGRITDVGRRLKCPDCDSLTVLPPPTKQKQSGPQPTDATYDVWDADTPASEIAAASSAPSVTFVCEHCGTALSEPVSKVGQTVKCPDCDHLNRVPRPAPQHIKKVLTDTTYEVAEPPPSDDNAITKLYDFDKLNAAEQDARLDRVATNRKKRPKLPTWPTVQGVFPFIASAGFMGRWLVVSSFFAVAWLLVVYGLGLMMQSSGGIGDAGFVIMGMSILLFGGIVGVFSLCAFSAALIAIATQSSTGASQVDEWPPNNPAEWFWETLYVLIAMMAAGLPGGILGMSAPQDWIPYLATPLSVWLFFPLVLLSQLEGSSPLALVLPRVVARVPATLRDWLTMYVISGPLIFGSLAMGVALAWWNPLASVLALPAVVLAVMLYARMIGRLGWAMEERK